MNAFTCLIGGLVALVPWRLEAQQAPNPVVLKGLAAVTVLNKTPEGKAALAANFTVTGGIQTGALRQPTLLPFAEQQGQALRDAFITGGNLAELSDGLGTTLGAAYLARAHYTDRTHFTNLSASVANVIRYADAATEEDSNAGKYLFANATTDGKTPVPRALMSLLPEIGGETDIFGKIYGLPAGSPGADAFGDSRPFQTEPAVSAIAGPDYFNAPVDSRGYTRGPISNLVNSPSYPSGHTTYGYTGALLLAILVPDRYQEMIARAAEYGNNRIIIGAHYAMDVLGGRTLALYDMAHLLANDPSFLNRTSNGNVAIQDFQAAVKAARSDVTSTLAEICGKPLGECAREDTGRFNNPAGNEAFYSSTQTYHLPVVYADTAKRVEDVGKVAPEAGYLLTLAFPCLTLDQADRILTETEGPGGGFLDDGSPFGLYSRIDLYAAAGLVRSRASPCANQSPRDPSAHR